MTNNPNAFVSVPREPTEEQWGGLARDIVMWWTMRPHTGAALYQHLRSLGRKIPIWLSHEIPDNNHVPPKGTVAVCIYKAMTRELAAAPSAPVVSGEEWQPIETAPKDGTPVLIFTPDDNFSPITGIDVAVWEEKFKTFFIYGEPVNKQPNKWRPLPAPPGEATSAVSGEEELRKAWEDLRAQAKAKPRVLHWIERFSGGLDFDEDILFDRIVEEFRAALKQGGDRG